MGRWKDDLTKVYIAPFQGGGTPLLWFAVQGSEPAIFVHSLGANMGPQVSWLLQDTRTKVVEKDPGLSAVMRDLHQLKGTQRDITSVLESLKRYVCGNHLNEGFCSKCFLKLFVFLHPCCTTGWLLLHMLRQSKGCTATC